MKLTPTKFYAAYPDGLLLSEGDEFTFDGRKFVVHDKRPGYTSYGPREYQVSDKELGFGILPYAGITNKQEAVRLACDAWKRQPPERLAMALKKAQKSRDKLAFLNP
jgi:hypothetical protein